MSLDASEAAPQSPYVKLISKDGHEFTVARDVVACSGFIRNILNSPSEWKETSTAVPEIRLAQIDTIILEKVVQYFFYKHRYDHDAKRPKFNIPLELVTQVLMAANFLDT